MSSDTQYHVAIELGFSEKIVRRALQKYRFKTAGDFVDYLEIHTEEFAVDEEVDEEPAPGEEKITIAPFPGEEVVKVESVPSTTAKFEKALREETEELYSQSVCLKCFERKRCFVTLPCSHFAICDHCEKRLTRCPLPDCREAIECSIKTYL